MDDLRRMVVMLTLKFSIGKKLEKADGSPKDPVDWRRGWESRI
jgi:hypothetical protein